MGILENLGDLFRNAPESGTDTAISVKEVVLDDMVVMEGGAEKNAPISSEELPIDEEVEVEGGVEEQRKAA